MMSAIFVAASITDNPKVLTAGLQEREFPYTLGKIDFEADKSHVCALIADETGLLVEILMPSLQTIDPGRLAYDHPDSILARVGGDLESEVTYPTEQHLTWQVLNCRNIISAQLVRGVRTFAAGQAQSKSSA
jgi:hypothetical protein